jgi:hypothetical protein
VPIDTTKEGRWLTYEHAENLLPGKLVIKPRHLRAGDPETTPAAAVLAQGESVIVPPEPVHRQNGLMPFQSDAALMRRASDRAINVDVLFPVLHGMFGQKESSADQRCSPIIGLEPYFKSASEGFKGKKPHETKHSQDDRIVTLCASACAGRSSARASTGRQESAHFFASSGH